MKQLCKCRYAVNTSYTLHNLMHLLLCNLTVQAGGCVIVTEQGKHAAMTGMGGRLTRVPVLIIMDCSTEVSLRRVGRKGLAGSAPSSAGASLNSWLGPLEVRFSQDCTLSSPTDCAVMRWAGCSAGIPAVYHSTRERRMLTRHCRAWRSSCKPQISNAEFSSVRGGAADDCELIVGQHLPAMNSFESATCT